jgi:hypothetical protein
VTELKQLLDEFDRLSGKREQVGRDAALLAWRQSRKGGGEKTQQEIATEVSRSQYAISRWCQVGAKIDGGDQRSFSEMYAETWSRMAKTRVLDNEQITEQPPVAKQVVEAIVADPVVAKQAEQKIAEIRRAEQKAEREEQDRKFAEHEKRMAAKDREPFEDFEDRLNNPVRLEFEIKIDTDIVLGKIIDATKELEKIIARCEPDQKQELFSKLEVVVSRLTALLVEDVISNAQQKNN